MMEGMFERKFYSSQENIPCVPECYMQNLPLSLQSSRRNRGHEEVPIELFRGKCSRLTAHL